jgi:formamidopyrimidine-DNA glycosylase
MPELPEAQTIATQLDRCTRGATVRSVRVTCRKIVRVESGTLAAALTGRRIESVSRRGKRVVMNLSGEATLVFRLGMTGQIIVAEADAPRDRHVHVRIMLDSGERELRYRDVRKFGSLWFTEPPHSCGAESAPHQPGPSASVNGVTGHNRPATGIDTLGPEPLEVSPADFARLLRRNRQIKALLLDQSAIAGVGNIYCDESLHAAGIHPLTRAADVETARARRLHRALRRILTAAIRAGGSTLRDYRSANGDEGQFQIKHRVYGRQGRPCPKCGATIIRIQAAGRSSHLCPACQPMKPPSKTA